MIRTISETFLMELSAAICGRPEGSGAYDSTSDPERIVIIQNTWFYICSVNLSSFSALLRLLIDTRKQSRKENSFCILRHGSLLILIIYQSLSLQDCWTLTTSLQERCFWSEMFSQFASARGIPALWQYDCTKHCNGCLVTGKRYLKKQKKAKEMNGKDQCLGWVEGKKGEFYV